MSGTPPVLIDPAADCVAPDGPYLKRRLAALNAILLSSDSATLALERWCRDSGLPGNDAITATVLAASDVHPTDDQRARLRVGGSDLVCCRRVRLTYCGHVLSEADNYYVPDRLTRAMRRRLDQTTVSFGRVVRALRYRRVRLYDEILWPSDATELAAVPSPVVLRHRALLLRWDGLPFSEVVEDYTRDALLIGIAPR